MTMHLYSNKTLKPKYKANIKNFVKFSVTGTRVATVIDSLGRQAKYPSSLIKGPGIYFAGFLPSMDILRTDIRISNDKNKRDLHISQSDKFLKEEIQGENKTVVDYLLEKLPAIIERLRDVVPERFSEFKNEN